MNEKRGMKPKQPLKQPKKLKYPDMIPLKIVVKLDPLQIGVFFKRYHGDKKNKLYIVELQNLLSLGDAFQMTSALYSNHSEYFHDSKVPFDQVNNIIEKMLEFIQNELNEDMDELNNGVEVYEKSEQIGLDVQGNYENLQFLAEMKKEKTTKRISKEI